MGICINNPTFVKAELFVDDQKLIPLKILFKVMKSICKITVKQKKSSLCGTGFFLNYSKRKKYLITCYHVINPRFENENIEIKIHNNKIMKLDLKNRLTNF